MTQMAEIVILAEGGAGNQIIFGLILMLVVPLVFATLTVGVASLGSVRSLGRLGIRTVLYFAATTSVAIVIGMVFYLIVAAIIAVVVISFWTSYGDQFMQYME